MPKKTAKTREFVLDCSIVMAWFFEDESDPYAEAVEDSLPSASAVVASLWPLEVGNALLVGERRRRTTEAKVSTFLQVLRVLPIELDGETAAHAWQETLSLARTHKLSVYDAAYLELAARRSLPLASLDKNLKAAAAAVGVAMYEP
jgi:predicted nucleic acid-binding protein